MYRPFRYLLRKYFILARSHVNVYAAFGLQQENALCRYAILNNLFFFVSVPCIYTGILFFFFFFFGFFLLLKFNAKLLKFLQLSAGSIPSISIKSI